MFSASVLRQGLEVPASEPTLTAAKDKCPQVEWPVLCAAFLGIPPGAQGSQPAGATADLRRFW
jgi:hypothetical protein